MALRVPISARKGDDDQDQHLGGQETVYDTMSQAWCDGSPLFPMLVAFPMQLANSLLYSLTIEGLVMGAAHQGIYRLRAKGAVQVSLSGGDGGPPAYQPHDVAHISPTKVEISSVH